VERRGRESVAELSRRDEILEVASRLIATSGVRTSLQQITEAADILPGSLYHHFKSKDEILVELMQRYHAGLDQIGRDTQLALDGPGYQPGRARVIELGEQVAMAAVRHQAALQLTFYETPSVSPELIELVQRPPARLRQGMLDTLRAIRWSGGLRPGLDLPSVADRECQTMLHAGLDVIAEHAPPREAASAFGQILLDGLATGQADDARLDASPALAAASQVVRTWVDLPQPQPADTAGRVRAAARTQFARRGFEATTLRDIASAAGVGLGTVHRVTGSKEAVLAGIMRAFGERVADGWASIFRSDSTPVEMLDAMAWININTLYHFPDEFKIQLAWLRQAPPDTAEPGWSFSRQLSRLAELLADGIAAGEIRPGICPTGLLARYVITVQWIPENILAALGPRRSLLLARDTVLRGIAGR
jgi:AcrR family transcriptional regulator